jgi:Flp pilus assembly protein TadD
MSSRDATARRSWLDEPWRVYLLVGGLALLARLVYLWQIRHAPFFELRIGDAHVYHLWARRIADGDWIGERVFYQAPLYPYLLAVVYRWIGDSTLVVRIVQAVMGAGSCVLLAHAARSLFGSRVALLAGVGLAVYPPAIFLDGLIQKSALGTLLLTALLAVVCAIAVHASARLWLGAGVLLGLLALTRENALIFAALIGIWAVVYFWREPGKRKTVWVGVFLAGMLLVLGPVVLRSLTLSGEVHVTTSQLGTNFYIGNNPAATGTYQALLFGRGDARREREDATRLAERALGRPLTPSEVSRFWLRRSFDYINERPVVWLRLVGRKLALTFNAAELADTEAQQVYAEWSSLLRVPGHLLHFGILLPLAAFGAVTTRDSWRRIWLIYLLIAGYAASVAAFYVLARYRFPLVPLLMLLAAGGLVEAYDRLRHGDRRRLIAAGAAGVVVAVVANVPIARTELSTAVANFNIGAKLGEDPRRLAEAMEHYERALAIEPGYPEAHYGMGLALVRLGRPAEAVDRYRRALELRPDYADAWATLGAAMAEQRRLDPAASHLRRALELEPDHAMAHNNLGSVLAMQGDVAAAERHFARAVELDPDDASARANLDRARELLRGSSATRTRD